MKYREILDKSGFNVLLSGRRSNRSPCHSREIYLPICRGYSSGDNSDEHNQYRPACCDACISWSNRWRVVIVHAMTAADLRILRFAAPSCERGVRKYTAPQGYYSMTCSAGYPEIAMRR